MNTSRKLLVPALNNDTRSGMVMEFAADRDGFEYLTFEVRRLSSGESHSADTKSSELCVVALGGKFQACTSQGDWESVGVRPNVFSGMPHALYLSLNTQFTITTSGSVFRRVAPFSACIRATENWTKPLSFAMAAWC